MPAQLEVVTKPLILVTSDVRAGRLVERVGGAFDRTSFVVSQDKATDVIGLGDQVRYLRRLDGAPAGLIAVGDKAARTSLQVRQELPQAVDKVVLLGTTNESNLEVPGDVAKDVLVFRPEHRQEVPMLDGAEYLLYRVDGPHGRITLEEERNEAFKTGGGHTNVIDLARFLQGNQVTA